MVSDRQVVVRRSRAVEARLLLTEARLDQTRILTKLDEPLRDARLIHQLRQAGHRISPLRDLLSTLQAQGLVRGR